MSASLVGCTEDDAGRMAPPTPATANESRTETALPTDSTDTNTPDAVITDWTDGKAGECVPMTEEEIERLLNH
ncbi:MAG: hypothetical protein IJ013_07600 [Bacteroidaceae bacterium]|nr:hypothetical protein [Bacteroidaceae bacterium]